ncbi:MAG: hypothetical protein U0840_28310 [Gemmataceae bacterium]
MARRPTVEAAPLHDWHRELLRLRLGASHLAGLDPSPGQIRYLLEHLLVIERLSDLLLGLHFAPDAGTPVPAGIWRDL